jgi:hypothetical protein
MNKFVVVVVVTPSSLSRLLVILYQDFLGKFSVQGWFAIASKRSLNSLV